MDLLLVTIDCLRADHVGCYGYERDTTPTLDELADRGVALDGVSNSPGTRWALQTVHSGAYHGQFSGVGLPDTYTGKLACQFAAAGYDTAGFAFNGFLTRDYGYDDCFDEFIDVPHVQDASSRLKAKSLVKNALPKEFIRQYLSPIYGRLKDSANSDGYTPDVVDADIVELAVDWIDSRDGDWFAWVHLMDAHTPYARQDHHLDALRGDTDVEHVIDPDHITEGATLDQATLEAYDSNIRSADAQLARLLEHCSEETTVLVTGDHGEEFGDYGDFHAASLYSSMTQVPFIIQSPTLEYESAGRVHRFAQHVDIAPTLADAADIPPHDDWVGESLRTPPSQERDIWHHVDGQLGARQGDWKYITPADDAGRAYHTPYGESDAVEASDADAAIVDQLEASVERYREFCAVNPLGDGVESDISDADLTESVESNLEELGYLN